MIERNLNIWKQSRRSNTKGIRKYNKRVKYE